MMVVEDANFAMGDLAPLIKAAAAGDLEAQRTGRACALQGMNEAAARGDYAMGQGHAAEAMFWARFAASHGHEDDQVMLAAVLAALADYWGFDSTDARAEWGNVLLAEAVSILDRLASQGNEAAALSLNEMGARLAPHIFARAKEIA